MNDLEIFLKSRRCSHCCGQPHKTYKEGLDCCKEIFNKREQEINAGSFGGDIVHTDGKAADDVYNRTGVQRNE